MLLLLRLLLDKSPGIDPNAETDKAYCFIFSKHLAAFAAFGSIYGSSLDDASAQCAPAYGLFEQPAWYRLRAGFHRVLKSAEGQAGTVRYGVYTDWAAEALKATEMPLAFLGVEDTLAASRRAILEWHEPLSWSKSDRDMALAALDPAIRATAGWLTEHRRLAPDQANGAAVRIVAGWVASRIGFVRDNDP